MAEKKFNWHKKLFTGVDVLIIDGQRVTVQPGDHISATISELGSCASKYEPAAPSTRKRALTPLEIETAKYETPLKDKSIWLNPKYRPGIGDIRHIPSDVKGLREILATMQSEDFDGEGKAVGAMGSCKLQLLEAKKAWRHQVKIDPKGLKTLENPEEPWLEAIARAQAALNVLQAEIKEVKIRLELAEQSEEKASNNRAEKLKFHGFAQHRNHRYHEVDGRLVEYRDGKPIFKDDGSNVLEYLEKCKEVKSEQNKLARIGAAKAARDRRERQEGAEA